jgi:pantoate--beta-alanine ligase
MNLSDIQNQASTLIGKEPGTLPEYFELADGETLQPAKPDSPSIVALVAARVGNTRLIDNVIIR